MVAQRLALQGLERLPVVTDAVTRRIVGIVSRSDLVTPVRLRFDEESRREQPVGPIGRRRSRASPPSAS